MKDLLKQKYNLNSLMTLKIKIIDDPQLKEHMSNNINYDKNINDAF